MDKILVFIPAYQCEAQISRVLKQFENPEVARRFVHIMVVDNRSKDNTLQTAIDTARQLSLGKVSVVRNRDNYGLGGSHKTAFTHAIENGFSHVVVLHGDDQGDIRDLLPVLDSGVHRESDACLGARFMSGSRLKGYSTFRIFGNVVFNLLFSIGAGQRFYDLGSGLNIYKVSTLSNAYWKPFYDNLMFNYCMILSHANRKDAIRFFPISWREDDQISNVKLASQARKTLGILWYYVRNKSSFLRHDFRETRRDEYRFDVMAEGL